MSESTKIEWADRTWNPWEGCAKVSPGCAHCYAEARNHRFGMDNWGKGKPRRRINDWTQPLTWNKHAICETCGKFVRIGAQHECPTVSKVFAFSDEVNWRRPRVFPSLCDWLDDEVPIEWLADFLKLIHDTPNLEWLLLTKRPELFAERLGEIEVASDEFGLWMLNWLSDLQAPGNVWFGVSVENQEYADKRIPQLLKIPAKVRFLSVEPLLEDVRINKASWLFDLADIEASGNFRIDPITGKRQLSVRVPKDAERLLHWVIVGGESGKGARPCNVEWIWSIVVQCKAADVPCFVKQLGQNCITDNANMQDWPDDVRIIGQGEGFAAGRVMFNHRKGGDPSEWPEDLRVREFPVMAERTQTL